MKINNKIKEVIFPLCFMLSIPLLNIVYFALNNSNRGVHNLETIFDTRIPFLKIFVLPYVSWYFFVFLTLIYFCLKDRKIYYKSLFSIDIGIVLCYIIFFFFQTTVPRPILKDSDILTKIIKLIYSVDNSYNCFPSIHVLDCFILMIAITKSNIKNIINVSIIYTISVLIMLSTMFIKQHVLLDVLSGLFVAGFAYGIVFTASDFINGEKILKWLKKRYSSSMMRRKLET
jgi:membrane-associated phospholipid phosphatase